MERSANAGPRTPMIIKVGLAYLLWIGIFALGKLTFIVF